MYQNSAILAIQSGAESLRDTCALARPARNRHYCAGDGKHLLNGFRR